MSMTFTHLDLLRWNVVLYWQEQIDRLCGGAAMVAPNSTYEAVYAYLVRELEEAKTDLANFEALLVEVNAA